MNEIKIIGDVSRTIADPQQAGNKQGVSFADAIKDALKEVNQIQNDAEKAIQDFAKGDVKDIQTVVVAMEKADLSLQTLLSVRNRLISAYQQISSMQV
ncbi:MAG TPA: flagellar hook-basal body complex protein FliE [Dissulfurispiraceae bacterium]|nr:flagellar hook-basal body complex protein FliE [Dissulfurispiraceae bacterium]